MNLSKLLNEYEVGSLSQQLSIQDHVQHLNILLIGEKGVGKSSLLSTFHRSLFPEQIGKPPVASVGTKKSESFTQKKKGYNLNKNHNIIGYDTRGLESMLQNEIEQVKAIRDGKVKDDVEVKQKEKWTIWDYMYTLFTRNPASILDPNCFNEETSEEDLIQYIPHAIIFVVAANQRVVPHELENFIQIFTEYGYKPLFAITKIDCHQSSQGDLYAATHLYDTKKEQLLEMFDLEFDKVKPIQNYVDWNRRDVSIENLSLDLLCKAVKSAEQFIVHFLEEQTQQQTHQSKNKLSNLCSLQ